MNVMQSWDEMTLEPQRWRKRGSPEDLPSRLDEGSSFFALISLPQDFEQM